METMKESGIKWVGKVPDSWHLIRMKDCSYMKGRIGWQGLTADEFIDEGPYLVTGTDFQDGHVCWERSYHVSEKRYAEAPEIQLRIGDLLVTKDGTIGKLAYINELPGEACLNSHLLVIRPLHNQYINRYLYWVLDSPVFQGYYEQMSYGSTMNSLSQENIGGFRFFVPSVEEQEVIADYLNLRCAKLDKIITNLERQIELLQKYKMSLITETVTKGLDKNVEMKDSGAEWIDSVPNHWEINRTKYVFSFAKGLQITKDNLLDDGLPVINYGQIHSKSNTGVDISKSFIRYVDSKYSRRYPQSKVFQYDFIFADTSEDLAGCGNCVYKRDDSELFAGYHCIIMHSYKRHDNRYFAYLFLTDKWRRQIRSNVYGVKVFTISQSILMNTEVIVPPLEEQQQISDFLDSKCAVIHRAVKTKYSQLDKLKNYKCSLIYEYVTGKKRVREVD